MPLIFKDEKHFNMQKLQDDFSNMGIMLNRHDFWKNSLKFLKLHD